MLFFFSSAFNLFECGSLHAKRKQKHPSEVEFCSYARSLGVYKARDSASLRKRYVEADGPVVVKHGRRRLKKVCCGRKDVLDEGAETSRECKEAVCRGMRFPGVW